MGEQRLDKRAARDLVADEALPVVARLAIEIRSDGRRTIARGAMQDLDSGQEVAIEVSAGSVLELAGQLTTALARTLFSLPKALMTRRRTRRPADR